MIFPMEERKKKVAHPGWTIFSRLTARTLVSGGCQGGNPLGKSECPTGG